MSYKVKPEDIPEEMHEICDGMLEPKHIASVINAAIDLELVSPPCRILRSRFGVLDKTYLFIDDNDAQAHASPGDSSEHWKGQIE